jgi:regulator of protease activity HflC (stomatin/prohibitin superfamily)
MLDAIINLLALIWDKLVPWEKINHYDRGVRLRLGKAVLVKEKGKPREEWKPRILEPGFYWKLPFGIDDINTHMVKMTTMDLTEQSLTTKDGQQVVVRGVLKYDVSDVAIVLLETDGPAAAVADLSMGFIKDAVAEKTWEECRDVDFPKKIATTIRREAKKWGINVQTLTLTDLALMRSIRLLTKQ